MKYKLLNLIVEFNLLIDLKVKIYRVNVKIDSEKSAIVQNFLCGKVAGNYL